MRRAVALGFGLTALMASAAVAQDKVPQALIGEYMIVAGEEDGKKLPDERNKGSVVRFTTETVAVVDKDSKDLYLAKFNLDTAARPYKIAMTATGGPRVKVGEVARGLIAVEGDTVKLIYAPEGGSTPTSLKTMPDSKQLMFELKRMPGK